MMKSLATQFDTSSLGAAVATPTCSSCCCCCCCVGTVVGSSAIAAQRVNFDGKANQVRNTNVFTTITALWWVIAMAIGSAIGWIQYTLTRTCEDVKYSDSFTYEVCTDSGAGLGAVAAIVTFFGLLYFVLSRVGSPSPGARTAKIALITLAIFAGEFVVGGALVLYSFGSGGEFVVLYIGAALGGSIAIALRYRKRLNASPIAPATPVVPPGSDGS